MRTTTVFLQRVVILSNTVLTCDGASKPTSARKARGTPMPRPLGGGPGPILG